MKSVRVILLLLLTVTFFYGNAMASSVGTDQSVDVSLFEGQFEELKFLAVKKGDRLKLTVHNNEENCLSSGYEVYSSEPVFNTMLNFVALYESTNLVATDDVSVGDKKEVTLEAAADGVYYVHIVRYLRKCWKAESTTVDATFENLGQ